MKYYLVLFFSVLLYNTSFSQLLFKNNSISEIKLCIGYYLETDTFSGWITEGWYTLKVNETKCLYCKRLVNKYYYYYGFTPDSIHKEYSGNNNLLVEGKPFKLFNSDKDSTYYQKNKNYYYKRFREIDTKGKSIFTVTLGGRKIEEEPKLDDPKSR